MKTPKQEKVNLSDDEEKRKEEKEEKGVSQLSEDELDSVAGGVAPIIKPPTS